MATFTVHAVGTYLADTGKKLGFLRKNVLALIAWPIAALVFIVIGWSALFSERERDRRNFEDFALNHVAALSSSYADHLSRTVELTDQVLQHVRYEWMQSDGQLQLERFKETGLALPTGPVAGARAARRAMDRRPQLQHPQNHQRLAAPRVRFYRTRA